MFTVAIVAVVVVLGGLIAFIGDHIGRRIGRKKLTLFGLRPKHTSVVVTILTGIVIAGGTLAALTALSEDVRTAIFHIREIRQALASSETELNALEEQLEAQRSRAEQLAVEIEGKTRQFNELNANLKKVVAERDAAESRLAQARKALESVERRVQKLQKDYEGAQKSLSEAREQLEFEQARVRTMQGLTERLNSRVVELQNTESQLTESIARLWEEYQRLQADLLRVRSGDVVYRANEIVLATVMTGRRPEAALRDELYQFLMRANEHARARGAAIEGKEGYALQLPSQAAFDDAVKFLAEREGLWVVRAVSSGNTLVGEPVVAYLELIPNELIYKKGEVIARRSIDGKRADQIDEEILALLREVNVAAVERGMITNEDGLVGEVPVDAFLATLVAVRQAGRPVTVAARAGQDTYTAQGPLKIQLQVDEGNG